jgi:hypothetical protein
MIRSLLLAVLAVVLAVSPTASAGPRKRALKSRPAPIAKLAAKETVASTSRTPSAKPAKLGKTRGTTPSRATAKPTKGAARVAFVNGGELRPAPEVVGRRAEPSRRTSPSRSRSCCAARSVAASRASTSPTRGPGSPCSRSTRTMR